MRFTRSLRRGSVTVAAVAFTLLLTPQTASAYPPYLWTLQLGTMPSQRAYPAMANFPGLGVVMYGGCNFSPCPTDTWKWTGTSWSLISASGGPAFCSNSQMVYDFSNAQIVLVCSASGPPPTGTHVTVHTFDGSTWTDRTAASATRPTERQHFVLTYDALAARVVLFGGFDNTGLVRNDTWEWNGSTYQWVQTHAHGSPAAPPPRYAAAASYHLLSGLSVVFGGGPHGGTQPTDTWGYDAGPSNTWTQLATTGPPERWKPTMAYDSSHGEVVLHGGFHLALNVHLNDTWAWNGSSWLPHAAAGGPFRYGAGMAYHPPSNKTVLFGGGAPPGGTTNETHTYG